MRRQGHYMAWILYSPNFGRLGVYDDQKGNQNSASILEIQKIIMGPICQCPRINIDEWRDGSSLQDFFKGLKWPPKTMALAPYVN